VAVAVDVPLDVAVAVADEVLLADAVGVCV